jgi:threonyl-tRNA synthetase
VRGFTQDDGHVFCTEDQVEAEVTAFHARRCRSTATSASTDVQLKIALRPEPRMGDDATWDKAEEALRAALRAAGVEWTELPGEGAFYGPKIEYHLRDAIGRTWQLGTMQVDFMMPAGSAPSTWTSTASAGTR